MTRKSKVSLREVLLLTLMLVVAAACIRLGIWQLDRLRQRLDRNAQIEARLSQPAAAFPLPLPLEDQAFRRVVVDGQFDPERAILLENQSLNEQPGYHLLLPLRVPGSEEVLLVDRGWIAFEQALGTNPAQLAESSRGDTTLEGVLLPSQQEPVFKFLADKIPAPGEPPLLSWRVVNITGIQAQMPYTVFPLYLAQTAPAPQGEDEPIPSFEPDLSNGPHLSYAIQWFSFAAIALIGGTALLRRLRRRRLSGGQEIQP